MKKSTYALIGFLAFTMIASIAAACIIIHMSLSGDKVDRVEKSTETIGLTGKNVELACSVDPQCLGGVRLDYDGKRVDDTLAHRLDALRNVLKNTTL